VKLLLFAHDGEDHVGILEDGEIIDFSRALQAYELINRNKQAPLVTSIQEMLGQDMLVRAMIEPVLEFVAQHNLEAEFRPPLDASGRVRLRAPIRRPGKVIASAGGYHFPGEPDPEEPPFFFKVASSVIGPEEPIIYRKILTQVEPEIELGVVIGRRATSLAEEQAMECVAGYTVVNDVTARALQNADWEARRPWEYTKSIDTFTPIGPYLVLPDQVSDPHDLSLVVRINGHVQLEASTSEMLFSIPYVVAFISQYMTLEPGDVIATGCPGHAGELHPGDVVELDVSEVGVLRNPVVAEG